MKVITLHGAKAAGRVALVDDADYELVAPYHWCLDETVRPGRATRGPYAVTYFPKGHVPKSLLMHKLITGWPRTDHRDRDGLNNQRDNLRPATQRQNLGNQRKTRRPTSSRFKGVTWHGVIEKWAASIGDGSHHYLGVFCTEEAAALAYDVAAREVFGEFALLNLPGCDSAAIARVEAAAAQTDRRRRLERSRPRRAAAQAKTFRLLDPGGSPVEIFNLREFCRDHNLNQGAMWMVAAGRRAYHKGYTPAPGFPRGDEVSVGVAGQ